MLKDASALVESVSSVFVVAAIEPCLPFWTELLGFSIVVQVHFEGSLGLVVLGRNGVRIQYQTRGMLEAKTPHVPAAALESTCLAFVRVRNLDNLAHRLGDIPVVIPRRITPEGQHELGVREPGGHVVVFTELPPPRPVS